MAENDAKSDSDPPHDPVTEELVSYLDGELDPTTAESMKTRLSLDPKLRAEADGLQRAWDILDILPRPQPSNAFLTRTVTHAIPTMAPPAPATMPAVPAVPPKSKQFAFWLTSTVLVLVAGAAGYFGRAIYVKPEQPYQQISRDAALLHNLRLYRGVDDLEYAQSLDDPDLFGSED